VKRRSLPMHFKRRRLLSAAAGGFLGAGLATPRIWASAPTKMYEGKLLVTLQLDGGADVTQLCDPKKNTRGEPIINHWAESREPGVVGNLQYAPIADNERLFKRFGRDMLVINGVDSQTNSHETGKLYNWTGANAEGAPSLTALHAANAAAERPLSYSVFGGMSRTAGIISYNRLDNLEHLRTLSKPGVNPWDGHARRPDAEISMARQWVVDDVNYLLTQPGLSARERAHIARFSRAREGRAGLEVLAEIIPPEEQLMRREDFNVGGQNLSSDLKQQMQGALLVFKSGLGASADMALNGFDSHENHDAVSEALFGHLTEALFFFWDYAEELGLADRIVMVIGTDFGRTNFYNDGNGKDHWPIGSYMIIEKDAPWGNRVVGLTDDLHFAQPIDARTLRSSKTGVRLTPAHVNLALRHYLGMDTFADDMGHRLRDTELLPFFDTFI